MIIPMAQVDELLLIIGIPTFAEMMKYIAFLPEASMSIVQSRKHEVV